MPQTKKSSGQRAKPASTSPNLVKARQEARLLALESRLRRYIDLHHATIQADFKNTQDRLETKLVHQVDSAHSTLHAKIKVLGANITEQIKSAKNHLELLEHRLAASHDTLQANNIKVLHELLKADRKRAQRNLSLLLRQHLHPAPDSDILSHFPHIPIQVVFDIGANIGQSAKRFHSSFPDSKIYCFEPAPSTYSELVRTLQYIPTCECHNIALGARRERVRMQAQRPKSTQAKIIAADIASSQDEVAQAQSIEMTTLDLFCEKAGVGSIDLLKIDTEGLDLEVLHGAEQLISQHLVKFIIVEAGMNPDNPLHAPFQALHQHLGERGYLLFHVYEQTPAWPTAQPHLRRADLMYIRPDLATPAAKILR